MRAKQRKAERLRRAEVRTNKQTMEELTSQIKYKDRGDREKEQKQAERNREKKERDWQTETDTARANEREKVWREGRDRKNRG